jgi:hypothetical protein
MQQPLMKTFKRGYAMSMMVVKVMTLDTAIESVNLDMAVMGAAK